MHTFSFFLSPYYSYSCSALTHTHTYTHAHTYINIYYIILYYIILYYIIYGAGELAISQQALAAGIEDLG